jgi:putative cardiolipin synthase
MDCKHPSASVHFADKRFWLAAWLLVTLLNGCSTQRLQPAPGVLSQGFALPPTSEGVLARHLAAAITERCGTDSVFLPLADNSDALRWRLLLADLATRTIDVQYYLWSRDDSGRLLLQHLIRAADRGVRVRILVDDMFLLDSDRGIALLESHPNIEVSIFNPWQRRGSALLRGLEFLGRARMLNRRMHNKLFVADNQVAIVGGRNIGNPYFGLDDGYNFRDLELLASGPVAEDISASFDLYWNNVWATRGSAFATPDRDAKELVRQRTKLAGRGIDLDKLRRAAIDVPETWSTRLDELKGAPCAEHSWVVYDDPPAATADDEGVRKVEKLRDLDREIQRELLIASAYFVPTTELLDSLTAMSARGVRVRVLTNSLASTNHTMVNSGYSPWRRTLLEAGIELYEYRAHPEGTDEILAKGIRGGSVTLHTKAFVIDRELVYVGSLNMDPRSLHINTEMGVLVDDQRLAQTIAGELERDMAPENAWRVSLKPDGQLQWESGAGTRHLQPARHFGQRIADFLFGLLPIKDQL